MRTLKLITLLFLCSFSVTLMAKDKESHTLKSIMIGLGQSMNSLNDGIFKEDYDLIQKSALKIAIHPQPKAQLPVIAKTLGKEISQFKSYDMKVHDSAMEIAKLAKKKDMFKILESHKVIMENCVSCHKPFREKVSKVLAK